MHETKMIIRKAGLMPVIKLDDPAKAVPLASALKAGGIPVAEITFRAKGAAHAIFAVRQALPDMVVGAGTVTTNEQADEAAAAGAMFIICPGFDEPVVTHCLEKGLTVIPGCATAGEVSAAARLGLDMVKFFPAEAAGGVNMLRALSGPFSAMKFIPTGGIHPGNLNDYLSLNAVLACGGSWMVPQDALARGDFDTVTMLAKNAVLKMLGISLSHIGINSDRETEAADSARIFADLLGSPIAEIPVSFFCGPSVEVMKGQDRGANGHIALKVTDISRAIFYFTNKGYSFDYDSIKYGENGLPRFIYFSKDVGGFAIHLTLN